MNSGLAYVYTEDILVRFNKELLDNHIQRDLPVHRRNRECLRKNMCSTASHLPISYLNKV